MAQCSNFIKQEMEDKGIVSKRWTKEQVGEILTVGSMNDIRVLSLGTCNKMEREN